MSDRILDSPPTGRMPVTWAGKPAIWMAWTGTNPLPDFLSLCIASVRLHNSGDFAVILVTPTNVRDYLDPHPAYEYLSLVHRADYLRLALLHRYGGIYLDMDSIALRSLAGVYADLAKYDLINYDGSIWGVEFGISNFGPTRRDSILTRAWNEAVHTLLDRRYDNLVAFRERDPYPGSDCLGWSEMLLDVVAPIGGQLAEEGRLSAKLLEPVWARFASGGPAADELFKNHSPEPPDTELLILNNALYPESLRQMSTLELLTSELGICRLLQHALRPIVPLFAAGEPASLADGISPWKGTTTSPVFPLFQ